MKDNNGIKTWKYIPQQNSEDAYEKIIADIQDISKDYLTSSAEEQDKIIETILLKIREINIFPIIYFSEDGIKEEMIPNVDISAVCMDNNDISIIDLYNAMEYSEYEEPDEDYDEDDEDNYDEMDFIDDEDEEQKGRLK